MKFEISRGIKIIQSKIDQWYTHVVEMVPNFLLAVIVLVLFYALARVGKSITNRILDRTANQGALRSLTTTLVYLTILVLGLILALNILHLEQTVSSILAGVGILGLALGFAFQDITANFISGIFMAFRKPIQVGDIIQTKDYFGEVEDIDLRVTIIRTFQGMHVLIPNKEVFQSPITNYTKTSNIRIDLEVGVAYDSDLDQVKQVTLEAVQDLPFLLPDREVQFYYEAFGDSSINFKVMFWIEYPEHPGFLEARSTAIMSIKSAYNQHGITIPFPIRTLELPKEVSTNLNRLTEYQLTEN